MESTPRPAATPRVEATPSKPAATPRGTATPRPTATPRATVTPRSTPVSPTPKPAVTPKTTTTEGAPAPSPGKTGPENDGGMTSDVPFVPAQTTPTPTPKEISLEDKDAHDKARFRELKTQALQDKEIQALRDKADTTTGDAGRDAEKAYDKALFDKVRQMDPSISDYVDRLEKFTLERLDGEKDN